MKWARMVDDPDRATKNQKPESRLSVRYISQRDLDQSFGVWTQYKFPPNCKVSARGKRDYEMMLGGYLLYYDDILRNAVVDHTVYCRWEPKDKKAKDDGKPQVYEGVTIFLSPKPLRKPADKYPSVHTANQGPSVRDTVRGQHFEPATTPAPDYGDNVDPPPPPPPPPPSLDGESEDFGG